MGFTQRLLDVAITRKMRVPLSSHWLQALSKAPRIQPVLTIKSVSGEPSSFGRAAESPTHCRFLIVDCRFDHLLENGLIQRSIGKLAIDNAWRPLEPDTVKTVEGRNSYRNRSVLFDGTVFVFWSSVSCQRFQKLRPVAAHQGKPSPVLLGSQKEKIWPTIRIAFAVVRASNRIS